MHIFNKNVTTVTSLIFEKVQNLFLEKSLVGSEISVFKKENHSLNQVSTAIRYYTLD